MASTPIPALEDAAAAPPEVGRSRPATAILSVETAVEPHAISVTLRGNGALTPGRVHEAEHLPPRLVIDFPHLAVEAASVTPVEIDPVKQVRVAPHSRELTRVVLDLVRPAEYHIERVDGNDRVLRVVFPRDHDIDPVAQIGGDSAWETANEEQVRTASLKPAFAGPILSGEGATAPVAAGGLDAEIVARIEAMAERLAQSDPSGAAPLLSPSPVELPRTVVAWPEVRHLTSAVIALAPGAAPLLSPSPSDLPRPVVAWPEIRHLTSAVIALGPGAAPLLSPSPSDLPRPVVAWPEIRHLTSAVVALAPDAAPLLSPALSDLPRPVVAWPEIPRLAAVTPALDPAAGLLMQPEPLDLPSQVDTAAPSVTPLAAVSEVSTSEAVVEPAAVEVAAAVELAAVTVPVAAVEAAVGVTPVPSEPVGAPAPAARAAMQVLGQSAGAQQEYTGDPISMDFQGADLRAVLRIFASDEVSGLNIVIDPSVQGEVDVALTEVPWDQAFAIILRANGLDYEVDGTVVRIASVQQLSEETQARRQLQDQEALAGELVLFTRTLSYARAAEVEPLIRSTTLSPRGEVFTDPRTNTLIIRDLEDRLTAVGDLLDTLDRAEPQVEIEARIVQASHSSARALGVQWGVTGRVAQEIGNSLPFSFPNRGGLTGRVGSPDGQGPSGLDSRALPDENAATAVDLGVDAATSAIGLTLAAVNGALNLDVVLSALENQGELRIISSPRVMTQNNVAAEILQGDQIPYQTVANNTVTVQFKEAALTLRVTPQITASNTVIMQVELENSFPDFGNALGDPPIPPIVTQRAQTTVQVEDGETTVIGGIFENTQAERSNRTPGLSRIPLLGWLFRSNDRSESTDELMIFLTPRIVQ